MERRTRRAHSSLPAGHQGGVAQFGFAVHGAGFIEGLAPHDAFVVLDCDTTTEQLDDFIEWLLQHTHVELAAIPRSGDEQYVV